MTEHPVIKRLERAVDALAKLEKAHASFMQRVATYDPSLHGVGRLYVENGDLRAVCLGRDILCRHRPVAVDGIPYSNEYVFAIKREDGTETHLMTLYGGDSHLHKDAELTTNTHQIGGQYTGSNLLNSLALALLDSVVFQPKA